MSAYPRPKYLDDPFQDDVSTALPSWLTDRSVADVFYAGILIGLLAPIGFLAAGIGALVSRFRGGDQ